MKFLFYLLLTSWSIHLQAQTREIAFKSHSGNMANFESVLHSDFFDGGDAGFGLPSSISSNEIDSVIYISATRTLVITKMFTRRFHEPVDSNRLIGRLRDTVKNDPLYANRHLLDSIRTVLKLRQENKNAGEIIFIGFDNKKKKLKETASKEEEKVSTFAAPLINVHDDNSSNPTSFQPFDKQLILLVMLIILCSAAAGWMATQLFRHKLPPSSPVEA